MRKYQVALRLWRLSIASKIEKGRFIVTSMTGNPNYPAPNPALSLITTNINSLEAAQMASLGGGKDDTANMRAKEAVLDLSLKLLGAYVEGIGNANPMNAEAVILSSGMEIKVQGIRTASEFKVSITENPGEVKLATRYFESTTFIWQFCSDPEIESNWIQIDQTTRARIIKSGLTSGTRYYFRVAKVDKAGIHPWSNVINIIAG